ncbi:diguanylate cyclase [Allohahella marinimesophila]|uniref:diguanylate cyclase n=1 Tax=Allohahella marinimesophila TaxID=1054972 RepID=A0ABP7NWK1_9GAMM
MRFFLLFLWCMAVGVSAHSEMPAAVVLSAGAPNAVELGEHLQYLEDPNGVLDNATVRSDASILWQRSDQAELNFGYTPSVYWLRFSLVQAGETSVPYLLEIGYPVLDYVDVYIYRQDEPAQHERMGDRFSFAERPIEYTTFMVPLTLQPDQPVDLLIRVQSSSSVQVPLRLWPETRILPHSFAETFGNAFFYGAMIVLAIYNLLIFVSVRDISYFYYVMYLLSMTAVIGGIQGITFRMLWPEATSWNDISILVAINGMVIFGVLFLHSFLAVRQARPRLSAALLGIAGLSAFSLFASFVLPYGTIIAPTSWLMMTAIVAGLVAGVVRAMDGYHSARYFLLAWGFVLTSGLMFTLNKLGLLPRNWFTENIILVAAVGEAILLSFALAYRMNHERRMRELAQRDSMDSKQALLDHQIKANEELDRTVQQRTAALEAANRQLRRISMTDGLTGLLNRRAFDELFEAAFERAQREGRSLAVLMIDLDQFKQVNDEHGHLIGDLCLVKAAQSIQHEGRRPQDVVARFGGEEFIVMMPDTEIVGAVSLGHRILKALAAMVIASEDLELRITASIGVAALIPDGSTDSSGLMDMADQNLYLAKHAGRNRVESGPESENVT